MTGDKKEKDATSDEVSYYDIFWIVWWNLTEWSVLYILAILVADVFFRNSGPVIKVFESVTEIWPAAVLLCIIAVLVLVDRVALRGHSPEWSVLRERIQKRKIEASGVLMSMGSVIFIVSDLHFHTLAPLFISVPIWALALWLEKSSENGDAEIKHGHENGSSGDV